MGLLPPILAFCACLLFARFITEGVLPAYRRQVNDTEAVYRAQLVNLFLPPDWARASAIAQYAGAGGGAVIAWVATGSLVGAIIVGVGAYFVPQLVLRHFAATRRRQIEQQLPEALEVMANGARAGLSLTEALRLIADRGPEPIRQEFGLIVHAADLGDSLEHALRTAATRLRMKNFQLMVTALLVARERGGNLPELLTQLGASVRQIADAEKRVAAETAAITFSAKVMVGTIPAFGLALTIIEPTTLDVLLGTITGNLTLAVVCGLAALGYSWMVRLGNPDL